MTLYDKYQQRQKSSFSSAQNKTPETAFAARNAQTTSGSFTRLKRSGVSSVSNETALQRLQRREETPVRQKWYAGEQPTGNETLARIYDISQSDTEQGQALYASYNQYMNDPSSPYFAPYNQPTSYAAQELAKLGYGTENGVDDQWFEEYGYLKNYYRTGTSGNPLAPTSKSSKEEQAAYWYYQLLDDHEATQRIDAEKAALTEEITYWAQRSDLNLSYDEIVNDYIDWSKYPEYAAAEKKRQEGLAKQYTHSVYFNNDYLQGVYWAAHNDGGSGNEIINGVNYARGVGNVYVADPKISAKLNPGSEDYHPYVFGTTLNDAAVYFGVSHFEPGWVEANRERILGGTDETEKEYFYTVAKYEETTLKAEEEKAALMADVDRMCAASGGNTAWITKEFLLEDCPTLRAMDEGRFNGKVVGLTRSVDYRWEDVEAYALERCAAYGMAKSVSEFAEDAIKRIGEQPVVTAQSQQGIDASRLQALHDGAPTIMAVGNETEQRTLSVLSAPQQEKYTLLMHNAVISHGIKLPPDSGGLFSHANKYAADEYMGAVEVIAPYQQAVTNRDAAQAEYDEIHRVAVAEGRKFTEEEVARRNECLRIVHNSNTYIEENQAAYDSAMQTTQQIAKEYESAAHLANLLGLPVPEDFIPYTDLIDYAYRYGSQPVQPQWSVSSVYSVAMDNGADVATVCDQARIDRDTAREEIAYIDKVLEMMDANGSFMGDSGTDYDGNLRNRRDALKRSQTEAEYFLLREEPNFADVASATKNAAVAFREQNSGVMLSESREYSDLTLYIAGARPSLDMIQYQKWLVDRMTDDERNTYLYIAGTEGNEAARQYFDTLADGTYGVLTVRSTGVITDVAKWYANRDPAGANTVSVITNMFAPVGAVWAGYAYLTGQDISPYHPAFLGTNVTSAIRGTTKQNIDNFLENQPVLRDIVNFAYDVTMGILDSTVNSNAFGRFGSAWMGLGGASGGIVDVTDRGGNKDQAMVMGAINFLAEWLPEWIGYSNMAEAFEDGAVTAMKVLASAFEEGGSEGLGSFFTNVADTVVMGDLSEYAIAVEEYKDQDYPEWEAKELATRDAIHNILYEFAVGSASGGAQTAISGWLGHLNKDNVQPDSNPEPEVEGEAEVRVEEGYAPRHAHSNESQEQEDGESYKPRHARLRHARTTENAVTSDNKPDRREGNESAPLTDDSRKRLYASIEVLDAAQNDPRPENKAAAITAVIVPANAPDGVSKMNVAAVEAASAKLIDQYGADLATKSVRGLMIGATEAGIDDHDLAVTFMMTAQRGSDTAYFFESMAKSNDFAADAVAQLVDIATADLKQPGVMQAIVQEAFETRVAQREMALVSEGALDGIKAYETAYNQARANLRTAQQNLETAQAELETAGQNLVTVQSQWVEEPSNAMRQGAVQQATKDVEGKVIVRNQQEQSVAKYEAQKAETESMLKAQRERAMKPIREQAQQEVAAEVEAENQQKAEREAAAEQKRQSDNTQALDADAFIEARYPNASEEQKQKIRETFAQTAQKKPAEVSKDNYAFASALANRFGVKVKFTDSKGAYEGAYTPDGEILLDRNATQGDAIRRIMLHELTHRAEEGKSYNKLADALLSAVYNGDESAMNADMQSIANRYSARNLNESGLRAELVADAAGKLLDNEATIQRFVDENPISARNFWEWLKSVVNRLRGVNDPEADRIRKAEKLFEKALKEAKKKARKTLKQHGVEIIKGSATKYSLTSWTEAEQAAVRKALLKAGYDVDAADRWIDDVTSMAAVIAEDPERLDFTPAEQHKMLKKNQEYRFTLDSSTLCAKRILYQGTFNAIQRALPNTPLMSDDMIDLRVMMAEMGYETPCAVCYVESRRRFLGKFAQEWVESYTGDYMPTIADVTTTDGLERMRVEHPEVYESYVTAMKKKGSANPKIIELRTDYRGDIRKIAKRTVDYLNRIGGLRIQSFSDFETPHLLDTMQAVLDMASKKLKSQAYTKVPNFAAVFGGTGIKINLSLLSEGTGLDADGNLTFSSYEGMDFGRAMELRNQYGQHVGTILVGLNDDHIKAAMADPRIDFIIPYHKSGWSEAAMGRLLPGQPTPEDYTTEQNERRIKGYTKEGKPIYENAGGNFYPGDYWDFSKTGKENAEIYLRKCAEDGRIPKFDRFLHDNGDGSYSLPADGSADGYWKMLIDYKMYDNDGNPAPQQVVEPNFNMEEARRVLNSYEGGANTLPVAWDVVDAYVKQYKEKHPGVKYSLPALPSKGNLEREVEAWLQQNAPAAPVDTTGLKERQSTTKTMQESPLIPGWSKEGMLKDPRQRYYEADTNAAQEQRSWNRYLNEGYEAMRDRILDVSVPTADDITDSLLIMAIAEKNNDVATFMDMALWYEVQGGTTIGQAMQARQRISKMTPSGMRAWVTGKAEADLKGYLLNHQPAAKRVRAAAKEIEAEIRNLDKTSTAEALSAEGDIVVTNNRWHMPVNEQQLALIKKYNLEKVSRPGAHYNRATIKQRMLEAILKTSDPEAVTGLGLNLIERLELMKHKQAVLTEADIDYVVENMERYAADPDTRAGAIALARAHEAFANITPATGLQKRRAWRYTAMLFSLPTSERNVIGNVTMAGVTAASDSVAVMLDNIISKKTGTRTRANLTLQERADGWHAFVGETVNTFRDFAFDKVNTTPSQDRYDTKALGRVFQNPLLEGMRNIEGLLMSVGDRGFWKRAFVNSIAEQQRVAAMNNQEFNEEAAIQQAIEDANYATFAEDGRVMEVFNKLRNHPYFADIFDFVMPFTKVPANITKRMFQYSPFGLAWCGIKYVKRHLAHANFDQRAFVTEMSRALTGSAMFTIGMALASVGFIKLGTGEEEDKKVAGVQSARGDQYSAYVQIGDWNFSLDTFMPAATPFVMGAAAYDAFQNDENFWTALFNAGVAAMGQIYNASFMSGLRDIFGGYGSVPENFLNVLYTNAIAQNVPAILGQIATTIDPYIRDTKDSNSLMQALKAGLIQRIPGLRELLPEKVDVAGQTVPSKHWVSLIDPFTRTVASDDPVYDELLRLTDVMRSKGLDDSAHLPSDALSGSKNTLTGVAQPLSGEDKEAYKKRYGDLWLNGTGEGVTYDSNGNEVQFMGVRELIQTDHYQGLSDIDKAEAISGIMSAAKTGATYEMGTELGFKKSEPVEEPTIKAYRAVPVQMKNIVHYDKLDEAYNRTGNGGFIPKGIGRTFTIDGVSTTLSDEEYEILWGLYLDAVDVKMMELDEAVWSLPDDVLIAELDGIWSGAARSAREQYKKRYHKGE